ncbi:hypothetical protein EJD97_001430 [Solanum chilense]|uniref:Uncharacterized protein n=1 Tax=Solanum chilense TaxID=4083 RepID=A0A6N2AP58_SOLCI|nr:hypothetical protein EJD97_001430 [Solanum chilense]
MKRQKNCAEIAEVMTYEVIDSLSNPRWSVGGNYRLKKMLLKEDRGIHTKCGDTEAIDGQPSPRWTVLHIRHC